ncbi:PAS domain S-box protein [Maioricimonas rarisocia]|nr:PAS domain S-box protein [Maioricimonas rarisocia]
MTSQLESIADADRLAALCSLQMLDSPAEESFDRLTRLAARLLRSPVSVVTLIDADRQFFKSCVGLPEPWASERGSSLDLSFCRITVETAAPLIVEDARTDSRTCGHPAIEKMGVIAYAGFPVRGPSGHVLGTLCVVDVEPRNWTEDDIEVLRELAVSVESEIALSAAAAADRERSQMLDALIRATPLAVAVIERDATVRLWNPAAESLFGWSADDVLGQPLPIVPPDKVEECRRVRDEIATWETPQSVTTFRVARDGSRIPVKISVASLEVYDRHEECLLLIFDDIREQVRSREEREQLLHELQKERALLQAIVDQMPAGTVVAEVPGGRVSVTNQVATALIGEDLPDVIEPRPLKKYRGYHQDGRPYEVNEWPLVRSIEKGEVIHNEEILFETPSGELRTLLVSATPVSCPGEPVSAAVTVFTDVTPLKESEAALRRSEETSRRIIESSQDCIKTLDLDGRLLSMSVGGQKRLNILNIDELVGSQWATFWQGEDRRRAEEAIREARAGRAGRFRGMCPVQGTNEPAWWDVIITPILGENGRPEQLLSISRDVTESVNAELEREALIAREVEARHAAEIAEERYRDLVDGLDAIVWEADARTWTFNFVSQRAERILGYPIERWLNDPTFWPSIIHPDDRDLTVRFCRDACDRGEDHDFEYRAVTADGRTVWLRDLVYIGEDDEGQPTRLRGVMIDTTAKKELEAKLRERADQLTELDQRKNQFLAILAHELRNPLAPIGNAVDLLEFCSDDPEQIGEIRLILQDQVRQLVRLIDDLMDISRITRGKVVLQFEQVRIGDVLETAVDSVQPVQEELGHELVVDDDDAAELVVRGDYVRLAQVVTNLLNNACKYTPRGGRIEVSARGSDGFVELSIRDNGIGIPDEEAAGIFEMFTQVDRSVSKSRGGLGIGLTLVKQLVEMHGGTVRLAYSKPSEGSEFVVRLPLLDSQKIEAPEPDVPYKADRSFRVLVVDDVPAIAKIFEKLVRAMGHEVTATFDPETCLQKAAEIRPDIIFSDICMPTMDGYELARRIRTTPGLEATKLVAMTGNGQPQDVRAAYEAGFDRHVVKPASMHILQEMFQEFALD